MAFIEREWGIISELAETASGLYRNGWVFTYVLSNKPLPKLKPNIFKTIKCIIYFNNWFIGSIIVHNLNPYYFMTNYI